MAHAYEVTAPMPDRALFELAFVRYLESLGYHHMSVKVGDENDGALRFYTRRDFAEQERQGAYLALQKQINKDHDVIDD